ncbi:KRI1 protein, partial [Crypturellus undulatus]|nr:KRI1 protein [Crypturellus undulatus]
SDAEPPERPERPMFLKDYERKVMLEKEGKYVDEEDEDEEAAAERRKVPASKSYIEEQRELKESFRALVADSDEEEERDEAEGSGSSLLRRRSRSAEETARDEADYIHWLKGQRELPEEPLQDLVPLQRFWTDPALEPGERFLRDYILSQGHRDDDDDNEEDDEDNEGG